MSEVQFNGFRNDWNFYQKDDKAKIEAKEEVKAEAPKTEAKNVDSGKLLDAMAFMGKQNMVFASKTPEIDPLKYLSNEQIASIESSMLDFEEGVNKIADVVRAELGNSVSESTILSIAANAYANIAA